MVSSMTGFGACTKEDADFESTVEIRCLNSRYLDMNVRLPKPLSEKEMEIRNMLTEKLKRGKVNVEIEVRPKNEPLSAIKVNKELFKEYYDQLRHLADSVIAPHDDLFRLAIQSPDVMISEVKAEQASRIWSLIQKCLEEAINACVNFRLQEGKALEEKFRDYIKNIEGHFGKIESFESDRITRIKDRLSEHLKEVVADESADFNRLEQEMIYYVEKMDISEEKVRLANHLKYFVQVLTKENNAGKKLGFITQEIGREINTIGSKANDSEIQKLVVGMKDELEKIKEQLANIV